MKTKAAVLYEFNKPIVVEEIEVDPPGQGEALVRLAATGVCHSNWHAIKGLWRFAALPMVLGDEGAGTVEEIGPGVTSVKPGDSVVLSWAPYCRKCFYCVRGKFHLCEDQLVSRFRKGDQTINSFSTISTFTEYVVAPESALVRIPGDVRLDHATVASCAVPTGWGAVVNTAKVPPGSTVAVIGLGGVGLSAVMGAVTVNAEKIIGVDIRDSKLEMSREFGVTHTVNSADGDMVNLLRELSDGRGVDYAFDTIGIPEVTAGAFMALRSGGTAVTVGMNADDAQITVPFSMLATERVLTGSNYGSIQPHADIPRIIGLYRDGRLPLDRLISKRYRLEEVNEAFEDLLNGKLIRGLIEL